MSANCGLKNKRRKSACWMPTVIILSIWCVSALFVQPNVEFAYQIALAPFMTTDGTQCFVLSCANALLDVVDQLLVVVLYQPANDCGFYCSLLTHFVCDLTSIAMIARLKDQVLHRPLCPYHCKPSSVVTSSSFIVEDASNKFFAMALSIWA